VVAALSNYSSSNAAAAGEKVDLNILSCCCSSSCFNYGHPNRIEPICFIKKAFIYGPFSDVALDSHITSWRGSTVFFP